MNLSHTLARNETKQPTSTLAEKVLLQQKFNILHHTADKRGRERNTATRKQKDGNGKRNQITCGKRTVVKNSKNGESETFSKVLLERTNHKLTRSSSVN